MILLFAPAKSFILDKPMVGQPNLSKETEKLIKKLSKLALHEIEKRFKVSPLLAKDVLAYYKHFDENPSFRAIDLYHGESYKSLDASTLTHLEERFLQEHLLIIDALYGLIRPLDLIKPYRLDFTIMGLNLHTLWKPLFESHFKDQTEPILSLASDEFTSKIKQIKAVYEVHFIDCKNGVCKAISVFNKQQRGALLRHIVKNRIERLDDLPSSFNGYQLKRTGYDLQYIKSID